MWRIDHVGEDNRVILRRERVSHEYYIFFLQFFKVYKICIRYITKRTFYFGWAILDLDAGPPACLLFPPTCIRNQIHFPLSILICYRSISYFYVYPSTPIKWKFNEEGVKIKYIRGWNMTIFFHPMYIDIYLHWI